jgi:hypothetical protein
VTQVLLAASSPAHWQAVADAIAQPALDTAACGRSRMYSPPPDPDIEQRMRAHHRRAAKVPAAEVEPGGEFSQSLLELAAVLRPGDHAGRRGVRRHRVHRHRG